MPYFFPFILQDISGSGLRDEVFLLDDARCTNYLIYRLILGGLFPIDVSQIHAYQVFKARGAR